MAHKKLVQMNGRGTCQPNLDFEGLLSQDIIVPPIEDQEEYVDIINKICQYKKEAEEYKTRADELIKKIGTCKINYEDDSSSDDSSDDSSSEDSSNKSE